MAGRRFGSIRPSACWLHILAARQLALQVSMGKHETSVQKKLASLIWALSNGQNFLGTVIHSLVGLHYGIGALDARKNERKCIDANKGRKDGLRNCDVQLCRRCCRRMENN